MFKNQCIMVGLLEVTVVVRRWEGLTLTLTLEAFSRRPLMKGLQLRAEWGQSFMGTIS